MNNKHDTISMRLGTILTKLNNGEKLNLKGLSEEFNVSIRTIQRDLNERLSYLPIKREESYYFLDSRTLGKLSFSDIKNFAIISGIKSLYPSLTNDFILDLLNSKINNTFLIKNQGFENVTLKDNEFKIISNSINNKKKISYFYNNKKRVAKPYKLVNNNGSWYLVADEKDKLKTYSLIKIKLLKEIDEKFETNKEFIQIIEDNNVNWFSKDELIVILEIDNSIIEYFERKKLLANYKIIDKTEDKTIIETKVSYENEILSFVQYWIPNIKILEPLFLQNKLEKILFNYVGGDKS